MNPLFEEESIARVIYLITNQLKRYFSNLLKDDEK